MSDRKPGEQIIGVNSIALVQIDKGLRQERVVMYAVNSQSSVGVPMLPSSARTLAADLIHFANLIDAQEEG